MIPEHANAASGGHIAVVGIGVGGDLPPRSREVVLSAEVLFGGARQLAMFPDVGDERIDIVGRMGYLKTQLADRRESGVWSSLPVTRSSTASAPPCSGTSRTRRSSRRHLRWRKPSHASG